MGLFGGLTLDEPFDSAELVGWFNGTVVIDNLYFGPPRIVEVTCSPRAGPGVMRVSTAPGRGQETRYEEEATLAGADHPEVA